MGQVTTDKVHQEDAPLDSYQGVVGMTALQDVTPGHRTSFRKEQPAPMTPMKRLKDFLYWLYFQYLMITCCIDMEPWEQVAFHLLTAALVSALVFTAYVFIPIHLCLAFQFFLKLLLK